MIHNLLCYTSSEAYEYQDLECYSVQYDTNVFNDFRTKMLDKFAKGSYSQILFIELEIDPLNNHVAVIGNDYYKAPLKQKIELNVEAKFEKKLSKKADALANSMQAIQAQFAQMAVQEEAMLDALTPTPVNPVGQW